VAGGSGRRWGVIEVLARGWAGGRSLVGTGKTSDSGRRLAAGVGTAVASEMAWAHVELALP
jgi:hypothetical protein